LVKEGRKEYHEAPAHLILNFDERAIGSSQMLWQRLCAPRHYASKSVPIFMPRWGKRATLVAAIAENGLYTRPPVIINRRTVENDVFLQKMTDQKVLIAYP
jgi:hypothetical protein